MIRAKVVGAGGYGGVGITELLRGHPEAELACLVDVQGVGQRISDLYPHLKGFCDHEIISADDERAWEDVDVVFFSTPDRVGMKLAPQELARGAKVIDYSGDFRFNAPAAYQDYASRLGLETVHESENLLTSSVYGLPELHRTQITADAQIVGNPGCFAVSVLLGLAPAVHAGLVDLSTLIADCKTGVSGAGKKPAPLFHYPARYDHMNVYRLTGHQHVCEVERELGLIADQEVRLTFTTQVVPVCRGIMSCLYGTLSEPISAADVIEAYQEFHKDNSFVRIYDRDGAVGSMHVRGTNYCNLIVDVDERTQRLRVISHIDNLVKGQAGSALQNMNLICGLPESSGLDRPAQYP